MNAIDTTPAAFLAGLVTSLHCVGMCGPLACSWAVSGGQAAGARFLRATSLYHAARLLSYSLVGMIAGWLGTVPMTWLRERHGVAVMPWLLVAAFLLVGIGLDRWMPKPALLTRPMARLRLKAQCWGSDARASLLGLATPLLPCGPLYLMFGLALSNGSAFKGAEFSFAFGLGTLPLLALAQTQLHRLGLRLSPATLVVMRRGLALVAALLMAWRLRGTLTGEGVGCCHA